jgi:hypothetical protein
MPNNNSIKREGLVQIKPNSLLENIPAAITIGIFVIICLLISTELPHQVA